jgi:hypothetical protein
MGGEGFRLPEFAAAAAIGADEIGVAKLANGIAAVGFPTAPQIASGKAAKHCRTPGLSPFPL